MGELNSLRFARSAARVRQEGDVIGTDGVLVGEIDRVIGELGKIYRSCGGRLARLQIESGNECTLVVGNALALSQRWQGLC